MIRDQVGTTGKGQSGLGKFQVPRAREVTKWTLSEQHRPGAGQGQSYFLLPSARAGLETACVTPPSNHSRVLKRKGVQTQGSRVLVNR